MSGVKGDPCGNRKARAPRAPRPAYRGAKTAPRAVFRAREIPRGRKLMWPGWLMGARGCRSWYSSLRKRAGRACPAPTGWLKESNRRIPPALRRHLPLTREAGAVCNIIELKLGSTTDTLHENAGRFLLRISRKPSPLPLHNFRVSLIIYYKCTIRRGVPRCRQNHKNRCWESWEGWDLRPAAICIRC